MQPQISPHQIHMKKLSLLTCITLLASSLAGWSETVIFSDTFGGSTLNGASSPSGTPAASSTSYDVATTKNGTSCSINPNQLRVQLTGGTTAGYIELQAIFASTPVQLANVGDSINMTLTFTNVANLLAGGGGSVIDVGLFNSGGALPVAGLLNNAGLGSATTYTNGYCQNWQGYVGQVNYSGSLSSIYTRPIQNVGTLNNGVQDLLFSGAGTGLYKFPSGSTVGSTLASTVALSTGGTYTRSFTIKLSAVGQVTITDELYSGNIAAGVPLSSVVSTSSGGTTYTNSSNQFDGLAIGIANKGTSLNPQMDISKITITTASASETALYNLQLNGFTNNTYSGAAQTGSSGDLWNNPDWAGVYTGSTDLLTAVPVLDSTGNDYGVTLTMTSKFNNNTTGWNDSGASFQHYTGQTAGSATPVLVDQVAKIDYNSGLGGINTITLNFSGLPTNTLVTAYVYGTGNGDGQGTKWTLAAANGGGTASTVANTTANPTDRDITQASSKGYGWNSITGTSDASGNLTITADGNAGGSTWWQVYLNGLQIQVGGKAPVIYGLTNQTVEAGSTVKLNPVVSGNPAPTFQWQENGVDIDGATSSTLTLTNVSITQSNYVYSLIAINALGTITNSMTLTVFEPVYSTMTVTATTPANGATGICSDTPLTATFSDNISLGSYGSIKIFNATNPATPVDTIDVSLGAVQQRTFPGDNQSFSYQTIQISGKTAKIYPHFSVLTSNQLYYVTIDPKAFKDSGGTNFIGLLDTNAWRFSTKDGPADPNNPVVNADGSADFLTVQGAVNSLASGTGASQRVINIKNGIYPEIVDIAGKHNVMFQGQSRFGTVLAGYNNATFQAANSGTTHARMSFKVNANDIVLNTLTVSNTTPQGGSQAEALMIESGAARCIVNKCEIDSRQDTILANINTSQCYFYQSLIKGNFDYIWGGGNLYFDQCEIRTIGGSSSFNTTAARTTTSTSYDATYYPWANPGGSYTANGMSFVNCSFTADSGVGSVTLAGSNGTAGNNVSWFGCDFAPNYVAPSASLFSGNYLFWQAENTQSGSPVTFANVTTHAGTDAEMLAATNIPTWFYGWTPVLPASAGNTAPVFTAPPAGTNISVNVGVSLSVACSAEDADIPAQTLTYTLLSGPSGAAVDSGTGQFTWRPSVSQSNSVNPVAVVVTDDGTPNLSATNNFTVTVNPLTAATTSSPGYSGGTFSLTVNGQVGPDYALQATTNLTSGVWTTVASTNSPATMPVILTDPNAGSQTMQFYRIVTGPPLP